MANPRQAVRVQIFNQSYSLLTEGDPREVGEIASQVGELMPSIAGHTSSGDSARIAVLASTERQLRLYRSRSEQIATFLDQPLVENSDADAGADQSKRG